MGINRIRLQAGSTEEMAKAEAAAAQNPELDKIRQQLFGALQDCLLKGLKRVHNVLVVFQDPFEHMNRKIMVQLVDQVLLLKWKINRIVAVVRHCQYRNTVEEHRFSWHVFMPIKVNIVNYF